MKIAIKLLFFFFCVWVQSQSIPVDKLLLTKKYLEIKIPDTDFYSNDFSKNNLISKVKDSITVYSSSKLIDKSVIDKEVGSCSVLNFDRKDFLEAVEKLNRLIKLGYTVFKEQDGGDYKSYSEFINTGLVITTIPSKNQIVLIYCNTCVFADNKNKLIKNIQGIDLFSDSYVFNCGGKQIFEKVK